jgi:hypothetical protein
MHPVVRIEQRMQELRATDDLMADMPRPKVFGRDRPDGSLNWLCHARSGARGGVINECERLVAAVPLFDEIEERDDGTVVVEGYTGNEGYGDAFEIDGEIVDFRRVSGDADIEIRIDGESVPPAELKED